jgi:hypothetical protein
MSGTDDRNRRVSRGSRGEIEQAPRAAPAETPSFSVAPGGRTSNRGEIEWPAKGDDEADHGEIAGRVVRGEDQPVEEATVAISGGMSHKDIAALTDESGRFRLTGLLPGYYSVTAYAPGHAPQTRQVRVRAGEASAITIALEDSQGR